MSKLIVPAIPGRHRIEAYGLVMDVSDLTKYLIVDTQGLILGLHSKPTNFSNRELLKHNTEHFGFVVAPKTPEDTLVWVGLGNPPPEKEINSFTLVEAMIYGNERVVPGYTTHYAVSPSGMINAFSTKPVLAKNCWLDDGRYPVATIGTTDPTDWQNSLRQI